MRAFRPVVAALIAVGLLLASCGRKAPPRLPTYERPPAPTSLEAVHRDGKVVLKWDYPSGKRRFVREFRVVRSGKTLGGVKDASYADKGIKAGEKYEYAVLAVSTGGIISEGSAHVVVEILQVPPAPEGLGAEVVEKGVRLSWSHPGERGLFNVYRSYEDPRELLRPINGEPLTGNEFLDNPLMEGPVYYTVRALAGGAERHEGPGSEVVELRPEAFVPSAPKGLKAVTAGPKGFLAWKDNPEAWAMSYRVYRAVVDGDFELIGESRTPSFIDGEIPSAPVLYRVSAVGPTIEGPLSEGAILEKK